MKYDFLVVGAGLFGSVFAHEAFKRGKKVLVIDRRDVVAGNIYTEKIERINIHKYGPHIFHTDNKKVWNFVNEFAEFNRFTNSPLANYDDHIYSLPFNMNTFRQLWGITTPDEAMNKLAQQRVSMLKDSAENLEEQALSQVGLDIYNKLIKGYTTKQWGKSCKELPASIIKRIPLRMSYDNNYFDSLYQGVPIGGYTGMIERMLEGIEVKLGTDYIENKDEYDKMADKIIYTGSIDELFDYCYGELEYRSLRFTQEILRKRNYQGNAVINYTSEKVPWTRIIEHKWFQFGKSDKGNDIANTVISREYSIKWQKGLERFYPINDEKNIALYNKYRLMASNMKNINFGGRLAEYKYMNMDDVIESAFLLCNELIK